MDEQTIRRPRREASAIRALILEAAAGEFAERGYAGATTAAIARRADVTEAQLFRYFETKSALFRFAVAEPIDRQFAEFNARMLAAEDWEGDRNRQIGRYVREILQFIESHSRLLMALIVAQSYAPEGTEEPIGSLTEYFDLGARLMANRVGRRAAVDPNLMVRLSFAAVLGSVLFREMLYPQCVANDRELEAATVRFVTDGINANGP